MTDGWPRSPVYSIPYIGSRTIARGALLRGRTGKIEETIVAAGASCREIERAAIEVCREAGVPQTDRNIIIAEETR